MNPASPIRVFGRAGERVCLILPFLFFGAIAFEWHVQGALDPWSRNLWHLLANVLFLNTLHVIFTFELALTVPEYRQVIERHSRWPGYGFLFLIAAVLIGLKAAENNVRGILGGLVAVAVVAIVARHALKQNMGLSLLYNVLARRSGELSDSQMAKLDLIENRERFYFKTLIAMMVSGFALTQVHFAGALGVVPAIRWMFTFLGCAMTLHLAASYLAVDRVRFRGKALFFARLLLMISSFHSYLGMIGFNIVHGVEYYLVYKRIQGHSQSDPAFAVGKTVVFLLALIVIAGAVADPASGIFGMLGAGAWGESWLVKSVVIFSGGLVFFHYYLDEVLFAMKRPEVRRLTGHWLLSDRPLPPHPNREAQQNEAARHIDPNRSVAALVPEAWIQSDGERGQQEWRA